MVGREMLVVCACDMRVVVVWGVITVVIRDGVGVVRYLYVLVYFIEVVDSDAI